MNTEFIFKKAAISDLELSFAIRKNAMFEYIQQSKGWDETAEMKQHIEDFNTDVMQIIHTGSKPIGVFESVDEEGIIYVHGLYILKEFQNRKIGSRIMKEIIHKANSENKPVKLQVLKVNTGARDFYLKHGFTIEEENEYYFKMIYKHIE